MVNLQPFLKLGLRNGIESNRPRLVNLSSPVAVIEGLHRFWKDHQQATECSTARMSCTGFSLVSLSKGLEWTPQNKKTRIWWECNGRPAELARWQEQGPDGVAAWPEFRGRSSLL